MDNTIRPGVTREALATALEEEPAAAGDPALTAITLALLVPETGMP